MFDHTTTDHTSWGAAYVLGHLTQLQAERSLAVLEDLSGDTAYMADLDDEIAAATHAYIGAAVTEIASLRAELSGPQLG